MPANAKTLDKLIGLMLLICGISLAFWGYQLSGAFTAADAAERNGLAKLVSLLVRVARKEN